MLSQMMWKLNSSQNGRKLFQRYQSFGLPRITLKLQFRSAPTKNPFHFVCNIFSHFLAGLFGVDWSTVWWREKIIFFFLLSAKWLSIEEGRILWSDDHNEERRNICYHLTNNVPCVSLPFWWILWTMNDNFDSFCCCFSFRLPFSQFIAPTDAVFCVLTLFVYLPFFISNLLIGLMNLIIIDVVHCREKDFALNWHRQRQ